MEEKKLKVNYEIHQEGMPDVMIEQQDKECGEGNGGKRHLKAYADITLQAFIDCRKAQNLTQQNLADASGIARANVARFENGTVSPTLDTMRRLAAAMGKKLEIRLVDKDE